jgi:hypothetical protein
MIPFCNPGPAQLAFAFARDVCAAGIRGLWWMLRLDMTADTFRECNPRPKRNISGRWWLYECEER